MSIPDALKMQWWKWWSNPTINLHADHLNRVPFSIHPDKPIEYFQLLQIRNILELEELPGPTLETQTQLVALAVASNEQVTQHLQKLCVLTMDNMVIHARPQEWDSKFGIISADAIRQTIEWYRSIPTTISKWQFNAATIINQDENVVLTAKTRAMIGLGIILKSFFPQFYKRWLITTERSVTKTLATIDPIEESAWNEIIEWMGADLQALYDEVAPKFQEETLNIDHDLLEDIYTPLDIDAVYGGNHA